MRAQQNRTNRIINVQMKYVNKFCEIYSNDLAVVISFSGSIALMRCKRNGALKQFRSYSSYLFQNQEIFCTLNSWAIVQYSPLVQPSKKDKFYPFYLQICKENVYDEIID